MKKVLSIVLLFLMLTMTFTSCYDRKEIDDLAYVVAIGLDKGKTNTLRMSFLIAVPRNIGGGEGSAGGGGEETSIITAVKLIDQ